MSVERRVVRVLVQLFASTATRANLNADAGCTVARKKLGKETLEIAAFVPGHHSATGSTSEG